MKIEQKFIKNKKLLQMGMMKIFKVKQNNKTKEVLIATALIIAAFGVLNHNFIVSLMYIATILIAAKCIECNETYDALYVLLLSSAFFDYALYVPRISNLYFFHIMLAIMSVVSIYKLIRDNSIFRKIDKKIIIIYIIWFLYMCASVAWSLSKGLAIKYLAIYAMMFAFIGNLMIYNIDKKRFEKTIKLIVLFVTVIVATGLIEVLLGKQLPIKHYADEFMSSLPQRDVNQINARPIAFSFNPNNLAAALAILMPFIYCLIYKADKTLLKVFYMVISIVSFIIISTTTSRTGFASAIVGVGVFTIYTLFNINKIGVKKLIYPVILVVALIVSYKYSYLIMNVKPVDGVDINQNALSSKVESLENQEITIGGSGSINVRVTIVKDVLGGVIGDKRLLGYGVGNVQQFLTAKDNTTGIYSPHCYVIEILGDFGVFGILLYGVYYLYLLIQNLIIGIKKKSTMCFASVISLIVFAPASFGPSSITYVFAYWIMIALSISTIQIYKE